MSRIDEIKYQLPDIRKVLEADASLAICVQREMLSHIDYLLSCIEGRGVEDDLLRGYWPTLIDRGDGVKGHYCIGRLINPAQSYWEFWNHGKWLSAGQVFVGRDVALTTLDKIRAGSVITTTPTADGNNVDIDPAIRSLVKILNVRGIRTFQSCSGHREAEMHPSACVWIESTALSPETAERLSQCVGIEQVGLLFGREVMPVWEIKFAGETLPNFQVAQAAILSVVATAGGERCAECCGHDPRFTDDQKRCWYNVNGAPCGYRCGWVTLGKVTIDPETETETFTPASKCVFPAPPEAEKERNENDGPPHCPECGRALTSDFDPDVGMWYECKSCDLRWSVSSAPTPATVPAEAAAQDEPRPKIICLCGSSRFADAWQSEYERLSDEGYIVLTMARIPPRPELQDEQPDLKARLDILHKHKIELADEVLVLDVGGYVGDSTRSEIQHAVAHGKPVWYLSGMHLPMSAGDEARVPANDPYNPVLCSNPNNRFCVEHGCYCPQPSTATTSAAVEAVAGEIVAWLNRTGCLIVGMMDDNTVQAQLTAIISKHFPSTEAAVPAGDSPDGFYRRGRYEHETAQLKAELRHAEQRRIDLLDDYGARLATAERRQSAARANAIDEAIGTVKSTIISHAAGCGDAIHCDCGARVTRNELVAALEALKQKNRKDD